MGRRWTSCSPGGHRIHRRRHTLACRGWETIRLRAVSFGAPLPAALELAGDEIVSLRGTRPSQQI